jgi:hypothetical protein
MWSSRVLPQIWCRLFGGLWREKPSSRPLSTTRNRPVLRRELSARPLTGSRYFLESENPGIILHLLLSISRSPANRKASLMFEGLKRSLSSGASATCRFGVPLVRAFKPSASFSTSLTTRIVLTFEEIETERTQEFELCWSADGGGSCREIVRQRWNFGRPNAMREVIAIKLFHSLVVLQSRLL